MSGLNRHAHAHCRLLVTTQQSSASAASSCQENDRSREWMGGPRGSSGGPPPRVFALAGVVVDGTAVSISNSSYLNRCDNWAGPLAGMRLAPMLRHAAGKGNVSNHILNAAPLTCQVHYRACMAAPRHACHTQRQRQPGIPAWGCGVMVRPAAAGPSGTAVVQPARSSIPAHPRNPMLYDPMLYVLSVFDRLSRFLSYCRTHPPSMSR